MYLLLLVLACAITFLIIKPLYTYYADPKSLRRFPSAHPLAALTPIWIFSHSLTRDRHKHIASFHAHHGPIVRIAPNHLSFTSPQAYKDIYGFGTSIVKDDFYAHVAGGNPSMAQTTSRADHARKRRWMSHVFSAKEIGMVEERVMERVGRLVEAVNVKSRGAMMGTEDEYGEGKGWRRMSDGRISFDLRPWLNMLSFDAITAMFWSSTYGCLERGSDLVPALRPDGTTQQVHAMASYHGTTSFLVPFAQLPTAGDKLLKRLLSRARGAKHVQNFSAMVRRLVTQRLAHPPPTPDLFSSIPTAPTEKRPYPIPFNEILAECTTMLDAGNDTTQTSLANAMFLLSTHPAVQTKLRQTLTASLPDQAGLVVGYYNHLQHMPYLRAVLDESFRVHTPVRFGLPRRTTEATKIAGHWIAAGVTVSAPLDLLHTNPSLFTRPENFLPERWLPEDQGGIFAEERGRLKDFVIPFSIGPRACVGRNLAYMELSIVIAALVRAFEWSVDGEKHGEEGMEVVERLNANPKELWVVARPIREA